MTNVLFLWDVKPELRAYLRRGLASDDIHLQFPGDVSAEAHIAAAPAADIMVGWRPTRALLDAAPRLTLFINPGAGVQHLIEMFRDVNHDRRVRLVNGHGNAYFTAQHAVALLLALTNQVVPHHRWMVEGRWRRGDADAASTPLRDRTIGLLGYGAVNGRVHRMLSGFDVGFAVLRRGDGERGPVPGGDTTDVPLFGPGDLHVFLESVDVLVAAVPLTEETSGLIGADELDRLGPEAMVVQVSRGEVFDEAALYTALRDGTIAGAAIDVWYDYRPELDDQGRRYPYAPARPFHELPNVVLSPHRAASPFGDLRRWDEVIENIQRVHTGDTELRNEVDLARGY